MVDAAVLQGPDSYAAALKEIDDATNKRDTRIYRSIAFRRRVALRAYDSDGDGAAAATRLEGCLSTGIDFDTPDEQVNELAKIAEAFALIGRAERARELLISLHDQTLGYSLAPKKDPQYAFWRTAFERACDSEQAGRQERVKFMTCLITGMARTEGRSAAYRLTTTLLEQAVRISANLGTSVAAALEAKGLISWYGMVDALLHGLTARRPDLAVVVGHAWARLVLPYYREPYYHESKTGAFLLRVLAVAHDCELDALLGVLQASIETESKYDLRVDLLQKLIDAVRARSRTCSSIERALIRWRAEAISREPKNTSSLPDPFADLFTLAGLDTKLGEAVSNLDYQAVSAAERLMATAGFPEARSFAESHPALLDRGDVLFSVVRLAMRSGQGAYARELLRAHRPEGNERAYWDTWRGGAKLNYYRCLVELDGDQARETAFDELADDLSRGRESSLSLLVDLPDVVEVITAAPDWATIWDGLAEQLACFREYRFGVTEVEAKDYPKTDEEMLAHLYENALALQTSELSRQARAGVLLGREAMGGRDVFCRLIERLLKSGRDGPAEAMGLLAAARDDHEIAARFAPEIERMVEHPDFAVSTAASRLARSWGRQSSTPNRTLPSFYKIAFDNEKDAEIFRRPLSHADGSRATSLGDVLDWTWAFERPIRLLSEATSTTLTQLRQRCYQFINEEGGIEAFGPSAQTVLMDKLRQLEMPLAFARPHMAAAARALRRVAGELMHAGRLHEPALGLLLYELGLPAIGGTVMVPAARPIRLPRPTIKNTDYNNEAETWTNAVNEDLRPLDFGEEVVLGRDHSI